MPSKTPKQARLMAACAHGAGYSSCPPKKVATEFNQADKGTKLLSRAAHIAKKYRADGGGTQQTYKIATGDTLSGLAKRFKTTIPALMALNPQIKDPGKIRAGAILLISPGAPPPESGGPKVAKRGSAGFEYNPDLQKSVVIPEINPTSKFEGPARALVKEDKWRAGEEGKQPPAPKLEIPVEVAPPPPPTTWDVPHPGISPAEWAKMKQASQTAQPESLASRALNSPLGKDLMAMPEAIAPMAGGLGRIGPYVAETAEPILANMPRSVSRLMGSMGWMKPGGRWSMLFGKEPSAEGVMPEMYKGPNLNDVSPLSMPALARAPGGMVSPFAAPGLPVQNVGDILQFYRRQGDQLGTEGARTYMGGANARVGTPEWNAQYEAQAGLRPGSLVESNAGRGDIVPNDILNVMRGRGKPIPSALDKPRSPDFYSDVYPGSLDAPQEPPIALSPKELKGLEKIRAQGRGEAAGRTILEAEGNKIATVNELWRRAAEIVKSQGMDESHPLFDDFRMQVFQHLDKTEKASGGEVDTSKSTDSNTTTMRKGASRPDLPNSQSLVNTDPTVLMARGYALASGGQTGLPKLPTTKGVPAQSVMVTRAAGAGMARKASGFIHSSIPGRTDKIGMNIKSGSYVIPADVVAGHGQGNSIAGAQALDTLFKSGPYGVSAPKSIRVTSGNRPPLAPKLSFLKVSPHKAEGGEAHVPVMAAGGEFVVPPETVAALGKGDPEKGFRVLDSFVLQSRKKQIKTLQNLKPPKKD